MEKERAMFSLIELWEQSKESQSSFCASHGVSLAKFGYWRHKWLSSQASSEEHQPSSFIPIVATPKPGAASVTPSSGYEIIYSNGGPTSAARFRFIGSSSTPEFRCLV